MGLHNDGASHVAALSSLASGSGPTTTPTLYLPKAESDVVGIADWFTRRSGIAHSHALPHLGKSPKASEIIESPRGLSARMHRDRRRRHLHGVPWRTRGRARSPVWAQHAAPGLAGLSIDASTLGAILGQSKPHNVLLIIDACVAGRLGSAIQRAAEDAADTEGSRDPHRPFAQVVLASTFGRDPAFDGRFAEAFLNVVSNERWTGTSNRWLAIDQLITGLNEELKDLGVAQKAERRVWGTAAAELIPNPNVASRQLGQLIGDEEFQAHFDPAARGVVARRTRLVLHGSRQRAEAHRQLAGPGEPGGSRMSPPAIACRHARCW